MADRTLLVLVLTAILAVLSRNSAHAASSQVDLPLDAWQFNATDNWSDARAPEARPSSNMKSG